MYDADLACNFQIRSAFIDLIAMANWKESRIYKDGSCVVVERGQIITSLRELATRWEVHKRTVSRWLKYLEETTRIVTLSTHRGTTITICKYLEYQDIEPQVGTSEYTAKYPSHVPTHVTTHVPTHVTHIKKGKKERKKEGEEINISRPKMTLEQAVEKYPDSEVKLALDWAEHSKANFQNLRINKVEWIKSIGRIKRATTLNDEQMRAVFKFCREDEFWSGVVQSPTGLTKTSKNGVRKIDNILAAMKRKWEKGGGRALEWAHQKESGQDMQREYAF